MGKLYLITEWDEWDLDHVNIGFCSSMDMALGLLDKGIKRNYDNSSYQIDPIERLELDDA